MEVSKPLISGSDSMRWVIAVMISTAFVAISLLILAYPGSNPLNSPLSVSATATVAAAAAVIVVSRQKTKGLYGKTYLALTIGLGCWLAGELVYSYDSMILASPPSNLSPADVPWLVSYVFFGYYVFRTYRFFGFAVKWNHLLAVLAGVSVLMALTASSILNSMGGSLTNEPLLIVRLMYPIGDAVLIAPSVLLLVTLRNGLLTYTPWLFISIGFILIAGADIAFTNASLLMVDNLGMIFFPLYNAGNLALAGALVWYRRFGIYDQNRALAEFQQGNR